MQGAFGCPCMQEAFGCQLGEVAGGALDERTVGGHHVAHAQHILVTHEQLGERLLAAPRYVHGLRRGDDRAAQLALDGLEREDLRSSARCSACSRLSHRMRVVDCMQEVLSVQAGVGRRRRRSAGTLTRSMSVTSAPTLAASTGSPWASAPSIAIAIISSTFGLRRRMAR